MLLYDVKPYSVFLFNLAVGAVCNLEENTAALVALSAILVLLLLSIKTIFRKSFIIEVDKLFLPLIRLQWESLLMVSI